MYAKWRSTPSFSSLLLEKAEKIHLMSQTSGHPYTTSRIFLKPYGIIVCCNLATLVAVDKKVQKGSKQSFWTFWYIFEPKWDFELFKKCYELFCTFLHLLKTFLIRFGWKVFEPFEFFYLFEPFPFKNYVPLKNEFFLGSKQFKMF